jgi:hypothetical protein
MKREEILKAIKEPSITESRNSMGVSESWYNSYYMVNKCFTEEELEAMSLSELNNILKLAAFAADVFY